MANLYELMGDYDELQRVLDDVDLDDANLTEVLDRLDEAKGSLREKVDNIARLLSNVTGDVDKLKREERRLSDRRKVAERKVERMRDWVRQSMSVLDVRQIKTSLHTVQIQDGQPRVVVLDDALVPDEFCRISREVDKTKVMKAYKEDGEVVPGVDIVQGEPKLVIR